MAFPVCRADVVRLGIVMTSVICMGLGLLEYFRIYSIRTLHPLPFTGYESSKKGTLGPKTEISIERVIFNFSAQENALCPSCTTTALMKNSFEKGKLRALYGNLRGRHSSKTDEFYQINDEERYIYSAYLDTRFNPFFIRIFGIQSQNVSSVVACKLIFKNGTSLLVKPEINYAIFRDWPSPKLRYLGYYYGCELSGEPVVPDDTRLDLFVQGSNVRTTLPLTTIGTVPDADRGTLAVCVKAMWGKLDPRRLTEWIESYRELGVEKFVMYDRALVGAAARVLQYYSDEGDVEVIPFTFSLHMATLMADDPMKAKLRRKDFLLEQAYLVSMNDCFYRLRDKYKYILLIDVDELLVPVNKESLPSMIKRARQHEPKATSFVFPVAWHFTEFGLTPSSGGVPSFMFMQRHLRRTHVMNPANDQPKAVFDTDRSVSVSWHGTVRMPSNHDYEMNIRVKWSDYGFVHHFRDNCEEKYEDNECQFMRSMTEVDDVIPRLALVSKRVEQVLRTLHLLR